VATDPNTLLPSPRDTAAQGRAALQAYLLANKGKATLEGAKAVGAQFGLTVSDSAQAAIDWANRKDTDVSLIPITTDVLADVNEPLAVDLISPEGPPPESARGILEAAATGAADVFAREPSLGLDPENRQALAQLGPIGRVLLTPLGDIGAGALTTLQAGLEGGTLGIGQLMENVGLLDVIESATGVQQSPESARNELMAILESEGLRAPMGYATPRPAPVAPIQRIAQVPETPAAPLTPIQRIAQTPELPPVQPRPRAAAAPEAPTIPLTPERVAAAERVAETMDEVPVPVEFAGNINLSKLDTKEDVSQLLNAVAQSNDEFLTARRGVLPIPEIEKLADKVSLETILGRKVGQSFSAEQIVAARRAVAATSDDAIRKAREWKANPGDENLKNTALEALMRQAAFQEQLSGGTAEIGRALRAMREVQAGDRSNALRAIVGDVTKIKDGDKINDILDLVSTLDDPNAAAKFIGDMSKPTFKDKILEFWINSLLAGPGTHAVNIASNALTAISRLPEEIIASGIGQVTRSADRVTAREVGARSAGLVQGVVDGVRAGAKVVRGEELPDDVSKTELVRQDAISGVKGRVVRLPSKALEVEDEFFKAVNRRSELGAEAYRLAAKEAKGDKAKFEELYRGYLNNPTDKMRKQADEFARYQTFQNDLVGWPKDVQAFANKNPGFRFLVPFIRTPVNILKAARDRSLVAPLTRQFWADVRAGGRTRDRALAKVSLGTGITGTIGYLYGQDLVTGGGPTDPGERAALLATGWQPYSFKVGDTYYSYARLEPLSTVIGVSADFFSLQDQLNRNEAENIPVLLSMSLAKNVLDKTFLQGISNFFEAVLDPDRYGEKYLEGLAASFVPNVLPQIARGVDPTLRETETFPEFLQSRIPGASQALPERLDAWGDEVVRVGYTKPEDSPLWGSLTAVTNILNPVRASRVDASSPVKTEVARLGMKVSLPQETITYAKNDIELTRQEFETYTEVSGSVAKTILDQAVQTPQYKNLSEEAKKEFILDTLSDVRRETREALLPSVITRVLSGQ
jgi:hypothetical protein